jgi:hypothetical protein
VAPGPPWLCPAFAFVPVWAVSIPSALPGQRGVTPAFGYGAPHSSARGTSTLPNNALLSTHYDLLDIVKAVSDARVYGGIHFRTDQDAAEYQGKSVAQWNLDNHLRPR